MFRKPEYNPDTKLPLKTQVGDIVISTVDLCVMDRKIVLPLIPMGGRYETMAYHALTGVLGDNQERYSTEEQAIERHNEIVEEQKTLLANKHLQITE